MPTDRVNVPIMINLMLIFVYLFGGALAFTQVNICSILPFNKHELLFTNLIYLTLLTKFSGREKIGRLDPLYTFVS